MEAHTEAMLKALVAVAWADDHLDATEQEVIGGLISAFGLGPEDAQRMQAYAGTKRGLADVPLSELSADDRRVLLQHAAILTHADGEQCAQERQLLTELAALLRIPASEAQDLLAYSERRVQRLRQAD